jgi:hypothetical protein
LETALVSATTAAIHDYAKSGRVRAVAAGTLSSRGWVSCATRSAGTNSDGQCRARRHHSFQSRHRSHLARSATTADASAAATTTGNEEGFNGRNTRRHYPIAITGTLELNDRVVTRGIGQGRAGSIRRLDVPEDDNSRAAHTTWIVTSAPTATATGGRSAILTATYT